MTHVDGRPLFSCHPGANHIATGEACYTLGLLHLFVGDASAAQGHIQTANMIYNEHLGPDHPSTRDVKEVLKQLHEAALFSGEGKDAPPQDQGTMPRLP